MKPGRKSLIVAGVLTLLLAPSLALITCGGEHEGPGTVHPEPAPSEVIAGRAAEQARRAAELGVDGDAQILLALGSGWVAARALGA